VGVFADDESFLQDASNIRIKAHEIVGTASRTVAVFRMWAPSFEFRQLVTFDEQLD